MLSKAGLLLGFLLAAVLPSYASGDRYLELADSADYYISRELWDQAENCITRALRLEPANFLNSQLFSNLGIVQTERGDYEQALESFRLGLSIAPSSAVLYNNRARTLILLNRFEEAAADLDASLAIDSRQEWPLQNRGFLFLSINDLDNAEKTFNTLAILYPKNIPAKMGLANVAEKKDDFEMALKYYNEALDLDPEDEEILCARILLLIQTERYSEARASLTANIMKYPENPMFYLLRGYLHKLNYRPQEAQADRKIAIDKGLDPAYVDEFIPISHK